MCVGGGEGGWSSFDHLPPSVQRLRKSGALPLLPTPSWCGHKELAALDCNVSVSFHRTVLVRTVRSQQYVASLYLPH